MSETPESSSSPFAAFTTASGFEMMEKMWRMMQIPGMGGAPSSSSMMSDMMAPMTNIDELDKRITDMRAVEQWLKLNLNMLQSATQALEVQRATLATLKAFGAFAQSSMEQAAASAPEVSKAFAKPAADEKVSAADSAKGAEPSAAIDPLATIDPTPWWNLLQSQFNQIAGLAMAAQAAVPTGSVPKPASKTSTKAAAPGGGKVEDTVGANGTAAKAPAKAARKTTSVKTGAAPKKS